VNVSCGASNISFGMPDRRGIDSAFLTMSIVTGMNTAITNPLHVESRKAILAADLLLGRDEYGANWIALHRAELAAAEAANTGGEAANTGGEANTGSEANPGGEPTA
jgi:5-methyltetrahydrofolate--homocysteine methyltransferase